MILNKQMMDFVYDSSIIVPATYNDGKLYVGNNGISNVFFGQVPKECVDNPVNRFQLFAVSNPPMERAFFVRWSKELSYENYRSNLKITDEIIMEETDGYLEFWEIFYVFSKRKVEPNGKVKKKELQYTCLRQCRLGTLFCKCDTCGDHFVITPQTGKFYEDRGLVIPTYRCQKCIQKKRMQYAAKNK